ncbi:unnamed protein product, partial [Ectocarpus sp. 13 AM-2016]
MKHIHGPHNERKTTFPSLTLPRKERHERWIDGCTYAISAAPPPAKKLAATPMTMPSQPEACQSNTHHDTMLLKHTLYDTDYVGYNTEDRQQCRYDNTMILLLKRVI